MDAWEDYVEWSGLDETVLGGVRHARDASQISRPDSPAAGTVFSSEGPSPGTLLAGVGRGSRG